jgi:DNA-binding NtrC family response regulator
MIAEWQGVFHIHPSAIIKPDYARQAMADGVSDSPPIGARAAIPATRVIDRPEGRVLVVQRAKLVVSEGKERGKEIELSSTPVLIGSDDDCDLQLCDAAVSGRHLSIEPDEKGCLLRDLGSTNGTWVATGALAGHAGSLIRVESAYLPEQARVRIGETELSFSQQGELELPLSRRSRFGPLIGHSAAMRAVFKVLEQVAKTDATLLIEGESGTGKDVAARAVHERSARTEGPFINVDCGAIPASLIESELFGHARGAFTGATEDRAGLFEQADGGTVFLDEIGELPLDLQPKLLRVLETRQVKRVGEGKERAFDARVISATNRNLNREVAEGRFRQDLYFRLSVIRIKMPPLRQRKEEIPRLIAHFLQSLGRDPTKPLSQTVMKALEHHDWPGNVRELRNVVERLALIPDMAPEFYVGDGQAAKRDEQIGATAPAAAESMPLDVPFHEGKQLWIERFEHTYLEQLLERCEGNISAVARESKLSRQSCHRLLKRYGLV